jgi:Flp pilus assembly protein TadD
MVLEEHGEIELAGIRFQIGIFEEALAANREDAEALRFLAHAYTVVGRLAEGLLADRRLVELLPRDARVRYNLACSFALNGNPDEALAALEKACELGFDDLALLRKDRDLDAVRDDPRFAAIEKRLGG